MKTAAPTRAVSSRLRRWIALNVWLLGLTGLLSLTYPVEELSRRAGDLYFRLRAPEPPSSQVALVLIDDASLSRYGRWPWPRALLAQLVRAASARQPRALGVDILLTEPEDEKDDAGLAAAFRDAGNVVLAAKIGSAPEGRVWADPLPLFAHNAAGIGHVQAELGPDGICRRVPTNEMTTSGPRPAFALEVARVAARQPLPTPTSDTGEVTRLSREFLTVDFRGQIAAGQPPYPFPFVSAADLLMGNTGDELRGRAVLIGFASTEITDRLPTPVSGQLPMPGVEIHANLLDALLAGRRLQPETAGIQALALAAASLLLTGLLLRHPGWPGLASSAGLIFIGYAVGYELFAHSGRLISFGPFLCLGVLAAPLAQLENLLEVDRGLTRSLRQLQNALRDSSSVGGSNLRSALRAGAQAPQDGFYWKLATVNQLEVELASLYAFDQTLLESMQDALAVFAPGGELIFRNARWEEFSQKLGWTPEQSLEEFLAAIGQRGWNDALTKSVEPTVGLETELLRDKGLWQVRAVSLPSTSHAGADARMVVVADLTARLERDRARSEALGFVTHELRTPLVSIQGFAEFLLRYPQAEGSTEAAETIFRESRRLVAMINTYLDVLRMDSGARPLRQDAVDIGATVTQAERVMHPLAQAAEVSIKVAMPPALPALRGDPQLLTGALLNLVSNAVKYSARGSEVNVRVTANEDQVVFEVTNPGPVIPPGDLARLFEPFYRRPDQEGSARGWGLGLAFVRRIAEAHGGRVEAFSDAEAGTRFRVVLPAAPRAVSEVAT